MLIKNEAEAERIRRALATPHKFCHRYFHASMNSHLCFDPQTFEITDNFCKRMFPKVVVNRGQCPCAIYSEGYPARKAINALDKWEKRR